MGGHFLRRMSVSARFVWAVLCVTFLSASAIAWGSDGHQIVAQVATHYLTSATQTQVNKQLGSYTLADISTWPDNYDHNDGGEWSSHLHYVNLPNEALTFQYKDCAATSGDPAGCVITAINNYTMILQKDLSINYVPKCNGGSGVEPCPLSFLTHFLGDSHQPLHVAYATDEGGNEFTTEYQSQCTNLHSVWDSRILYTYEDDNDLTWQGVATQIVSWLGNETVVLSEFTNSTDPAAWGSETFALARFAPYNLSPGDVPPARNWIRKVTGFTQYEGSSWQVKSPYNTIVASSSSCGPVLGYTYYERTIPLVLEQLAKAGCRLAYLLNTIYDPNFTGRLSPHQ